MRKRQLSPIAAVPDQKAKVFEGHSPDRGYPYVWFGTDYVEDREDGRTVSKAAMVAIGETFMGEWEEVGVTVISGEAATLTTSILWPPPPQGWRRPRPAIAEIDQADTLPEDLHRRAHRAGATGSRPRLCSAPQGRAASFHSLPHRRGERPGPDHLHRCK
jgi:hypothetical protein